MVGKVKMAENEFDTSGITGGGTGLRQIMDTLAGRWSSKGNLYAKSTSAIDGGKAQLAACCACYIKVPSSNPGMFQLV